MTELSDERSDRLKTLSRESFEQHAGGDCTLCLEEGEMGLKLVETKGLLESQEYGPDERKPFSVVYEGPPQPILDQQIYRLRHPDGEELHLFLVPLGPAGPGGKQRYEAVFT